MKKNQMFTLKIETFLSSQVSGTPPKHACTLDHQQSALRSMIEDPSELWHLRYRHLGFASLNLLSKKIIVDGFPSIVDSCDKYGACILGKKYRLLFNFHNFIRTRAPLELVHSDVVGPMQTTSIRGCTYFMNFIDDFSCRTWVYFLKSKSKIFDKFVGCKALAEKEC